MKRVIYKNIDGTVGVLTPTVEGLSYFTIEQLAAKDVPTGLPYWIRPTTDVPTDRKYRNAWRIDPSWGTPDGYGE